MTGATALNGTNLVTLEFVYDHDKTASGTTSYIVDLARTSSTANEFALAVSVS
ncbi:MAG: hypothetical protein U1F43_16675 [Myxococcota bacterium]